MEETLKLIYNEGEEIRKLRFNFQDEGYASLEKKISHVFNLLTEGEGQGLVLHWRDREGDHIRLSSDADVQAMLGQLNASTSNSTNRKIYIRRSPRNHRKTGSSSQAAGNDTVHPHIICDGCQCQPLRGNRFKCLECANFDLCQACLERGEHADHNMILLRCSSNGSADHPLFAAVGPNVMRMFGGRHGCPRGRPPGGCCGFPSRCTGSCGTSNPNGSEPQHSAENGEKSSTAPPPAPPQEAWKAFAKDMKERLEASGFPFSIPPLDELANFFPNLFPPSASTSTAPDHGVNPYSAPTGSAPLPPHVMNARGHMLNMGFNDENGWLTQLLLQHNGDISKCLDHIRNQQTTQH